MEGKILFVCSGNTCRSSMAEALAKQVLKEMGREGNIIVSSAGTSALSGNSATGEAVAVMAEEGIDLSGHQATLLSRPVIEQSDLVLTMTEAHRRDVLRISPEAGGKVFTLPGYAGEPGEIFDPFGKPLDTYRDCARNLRFLIGIALRKYLRERKL